VQDDPVIGGACAGRPNPLNQAFGLKLAKLVLNGTPYLLCVGAEGLHGRENAAPIFPGIPRQAEE